MENIVRDLKVLPEIPQMPQTTPLDQITHYFPQPCLFEVPGSTEETVFLSFLLHGNEFTSFEVLKKLVNKYKKDTPEKSLIFLVGNVEAASLQKRFLSGQQDFNRIWKSGSSPEHQWAEQVKNYVAERAPLFATIDIHNNTGKNPFYSCISELTDSFVYLASLFSSTLVYFRHPDSVLSTNFSSFGPALTIECGESGNPESTGLAYQFVLDVINSSTLNHPVQDSDIQIFQTIGRIVVDSEVKVAFGKELGDIHFTENFESINFCPQTEGEWFCETNLKKLPIQILDQQGNDLSEEFLIFKDGVARWRKSVIPSMFTKDTKVITQDCLGYVMIPIDRSDHLKP